MVEENKALLTSVPSVEEDEGISETRKTVGFILTLILFPLLIMGTCVPLGIVLISSVPMALTICGAIVYVVLFSLLAVRIAHRTKNPGIRGGIYIILSGSAILLFSFLFDSIRW